VGGIERVLRGSFGDEVRELSRADAEILLVEHAFGQTPEKPRHPLLEHPPTRAEDRCVGADATSDRQKVVLVATSSM
jgi:hypothetical protein